MIEPAQMEMIQGVVRFLASFVTAGIFAFFGGHQEENKRSAIGWGVVFGGLGYFIGSGIGLLLQMVIQGVVWLVNTEITIPPDKANLALWVLVSIAVFGLLGLVGRFAYPPMAENDDLHPFSEFVE